MSKTDELTSNNLIEGISGTLIDDMLEHLSEQLDPQKRKDMASWKPLPGPQEMAFTSEADELFYGGAAGGGKQLSNNSLIATPDGWKTHGSINVGDAVCNPDGSIAKVIGVYPQGVMPIYRVTFIDGAYVDAGLPHLWAYWLSGKKLKADRRIPIVDTKTNNIIWVTHKEAFGQTVDLKIGTTEFLMNYTNEQHDRVKQGKRPYWALIPLSEPVKYTRPVNRYDKNKIIDPYFLGLLIGDGSITDTNLSITTKDMEIKEWVENHYGKHRTYWDGEKHLNLNDKSELREKLKYWGLWNKKSDTKFIPEKYLYKSIEDRFALIQGLIDTDGYVDDRGHVSYTTVSYRLAKDVQQLARSLGCKATITEKQGFYNHSDTGERIECKMAYTIWMQGKHTDKFMRLQRKKDRWKPYNGGDEPGRRIVSIEYAGEEECTCIMVDNPNHLYLTDDFIVTHNTDLMVGLSASDLSPHKKSIIFRSTFPEHKDFINRVREVSEGTGAIFKGGNQQVFTNLPGNKTLEIGSVANFSAAQKYRGRPHDLKLFDEVCKIPEVVYTFLIAWARTTEEGVPVRIVAGGNPPTNSDEAWVIRRWRPWLDENHPNRATPGELRWFATLDDVDTELTLEISEDGANGLPFEYTHKNGRTEIVKPRSRTFIPAKVEDNPYLMKTDYKATLQNLPEALKNQLLYGDFSASQKEDPWQVIPAEWVRLANDRWEVADANGDIRMHANILPAFGLDVAETGVDNTILTRVNANYVYSILKIEKEEPKEQADDIALELRKQKSATVAIDFIGPGLAVGSFLRHMGYPIVPIKGSRTSKHYDKTKTYGFYNLRSELWWRLREALDPDGDIKLCVPRHRLLREEMTAPRYTVNAKGQIMVETKVKVKEKLRRSPDYAESLIYAMWAQRVSKTPLRMV